MGMNLENQIPDGNGHLTIQNITGWLSGDETANLQIEYEQHCVRCAECQERVAMIRQAMQPDEEMVRSAEYQEMLRIGERVAMRVWEEQHPTVENVTKSDPEQKSDSPKPEPWFKRLIPDWQPAFGRVAAAVLLLIVGISGYRYWQSTQSGNQGDELVERAMVSMRQAWYLDRPIKTRVTGEFPYLPYSPTRGPSDSVPVNDTQLKAATVILNLEVAGATPTLRAKHALGRLHLLNKDFDEAEKLLQEVVSKEPQNALAYVDLGSAYFGQSEKKIADQAS
jgi:Flp pilus assembly protein TadD, contains TPR repeats